MLSRDKKFFHADTVQYVQTKVSEEEGNVHVVFKVLSRSLESVYIGAVSAEYRLTPHHYQPDPWKSIDDVTIILLLSVSFMLNVFHLFCIFFLTGYSVLATPLLMSPILYFLGDV